MPLLLKSRIIRPSENNPFLIDIPTIKDLLDQWRVICRTNENYLKYERNDYKLEALVVQTWFSRPEYDKFVMANKGDLLDRINAAIDEYCRNNPGNFRYNIKEDT
jgi:hypothetical protein